MDGLRIALLAYRGNPHSGGQGVYVRHLSRELVELGHHVEVLAGQPWPVLDEGVHLTKLPSLDLYRPENPFRVPWPWEFKTGIDVTEFAIMCTAGFPEPLTFSLRARRHLRSRLADFDVIHDNQCLGNGLIGMMEDGHALLTTIHHPITVDRDLELAHAKGLKRRLSLRRWYGFLGMQIKVAKQLPRIVTVSENSRADMAEQMDLDLERISVVPVGVDTTQFRPLPHIERVPGRLLTTASADVPLKGLVPLLEALAKVRTERPSAHLVVIGKTRDGSTTPAHIARLGLQDAVEFVSGVSNQRIVELYAEAEVAVVPSLYEGFSLPAVEAMACGAPLVATTGGALPEVTGPDGEAALTVPPDDPGALAAALLRLMGDPALRARLSAAGPGRVEHRFTWRKTAEGTVEQYRALLADGDAARAPDSSRVWSRRDHIGRDVTKRVGAEGAPC